MCKFAFCLSLFVCRANTRISATKRTRNRQQSGAAVRSTTSRVFNIYLLKHFTLIYLHWGKQIQRQPTRKKRNMTNKVEDISDAWAVEIYMKYEETRRQSRNFNDKMTLKKTRRIRQLEIHSYRWLKTVTLIKHSSSCPLYCLLLPPSFRTLVVVSAGFTLSIFFESWQSTAASMNMIRTRNFSHLREYAHYADKKPSPNSNHKTKREEKKVNMWKWFNKI